MGMYGVAARLRIIQLVSFPFNLKAARGFPVLGA